LGVSGKSKCSENSVGQNHMCTVYVHGTVGREFNEFVQSCTVHIIGSGQTYRYELAVGAGVVPIL